MSIDSLNYKCKQNYLHLRKEFSLLCSIHFLVMTYFHCRTGIQIRTRTQIPVLYKYYGKGIQFWIRVSGNIFCIIPHSHRVWNLSPSRNLNPNRTVEISHKSGDPTMESDEADDYKIRNLLSVFKPFTVLKIASVSH